MSESLYGGTSDPPHHHPRPAERPRRPAIAGRCSPPTTTRPPGSSTRPAFRCCWSATPRPTWSTATTPPCRSPIDELLPLVRGVVRGAQRALVVADLPFGSYQASPQQALETAVRFMKEGGAQAVKLEGGRRVAPAGRAADLSRHPGDGAHRPDAAVGQHAVGLPGAGPRRRGGARNCSRTRWRCRRPARSPWCWRSCRRDLAKKITHELRIPTIGIGAGVDCDAQVLVWQDMAGLRTGGKPPSSSSSTPTCPAC